jgi:hypothetical protein
MSYRTIASLSQEVFDILAQYLEAQDIVTLLGTGSPFIRTSIEHRASLSSVHATFLREPREWPIFFNRQTRLRQLHVQFGPSISPFNNAFFTTHTLLTLPSTLVSIHLGMPSAEEAWTKNAFSFAFDIESTFVFLQTISLAGRSSWTNSHLQHLPHGLRCLRLYSNTLINAEGLIDLPAELEELVLPNAVGVWTEESLALLPRSIHTLSLIMTDPIKSPIVAKLRNMPALKTMEINVRLQQGHQTSVDRLNELPSTLTSLTLTGYINVDAFIIWPPALTTLRLRDTAARVQISELPKRLSTLEISPGWWRNVGQNYIPERHLLTRSPEIPQYGYSARVFGDFSKSLTPSLTHLDLGNCSTKPEDFECLPPYLTFLQLKGPNSWESKLLKQFPKSLQVIRIPNIVLEHEDLLLLPCGLAELFVQEIRLGDSFVEHIRAKQSESLPSQKSLTILDRKSLIEEAIKLLPISYNTWKPIPWKITVTSKAFLNCPNTVTSIDLDSVNPDPSGYGQSMLPPIFPSQLLSISLPQTSSFWLEDLTNVALPPGLTKLWLPLDQTTNYLNLPLIPKTVTIIKLSYNEFITDDDIELLPPNLMYLDLSYNTSITNDGIEKLPRTLTHLNLWNNRNVTQACFQFLPPDLIELYLARVAIGGENPLAKLPPKLEILDLGSGRIFKFDQAERVDDIPCRLTLKSITWQWTKNLYLKCKEVMPNLRLTTVQMCLLRTEGDKGEDLFWNTHMTN